jgi:hypothetical protein
MARNCVEENASGKVLRYGVEIFNLSDDFDGVNETYHADCGLLTPGVILAHHKVVTGIITEMTQEEKDVITAAILQFMIPVFPLDPQEQLSANGPISLASYSTDLSGNVTMTLADGLIPFHAKLIQTQGGASATITCSLESPSVGFSLGANNKALLIWRLSDSFWRIVDEKGLTLDT